MPRPGRSDAGDGRARRRTRILEERDKTQRGALGPERTEGEQKEEVTEGGRHTEQSAFIKRRLRGRVAEEEASHVPGGAWLFQVRGWAWEGGIIIGRREKENWYGVENALGTNELKKRIRARRHESLPYQKQNLKEVVLAHNEHEWALKEENMRLRQRIQYLKSKYQHNLKQLEEQIAFVRWQRDLALNEHEARRRENEELQSLNRELRALVTRLEGTAESRVTVTDLGLSVDFLPGSAHAPQRRTHLALMFR
ncbi:hypothetical protein NDU88_004833 [Pleurodeles waltl]|uniref:Uncharacterized protein n=1 Tax=Pleurodeles waltl TaxID=8319 RepID=A0AAV7W9B4_PLEWA|nr:hypothetical protein NDU88_004833 [Pleurodeles waltl]